MLRRRKEKEAVIGPFLKKIVLFFTFWTFHLNMISAADDDDNDGSIQETKMELPWTEMEKESSEEKNNYAIVDGCKAWRCWITLRGTLNQLCGTLLDARPCQHMPF